MSDEFDPYREWLGLENPAPSYYELLGLSFHETDATNIAVAADRAITRVRSFRPGPHARAWSRLLDELRAAKDCLTDAGQRSRYDAELATGLLTSAILPPEAEIASPSETEPVALPAPLPVPVPIESVPPPLPIARQAIAPISTAAYRPVTRPAKHGGYGWGIVVVICGLALVVAGLIYRLNMVSRQTLPRLPIASVEPDKRQAPLTRERSVEQSPVAVVPFEPVKNEGNPPSATETNPTPVVATTETPSVTDTTAPSSVLAATEPTVTRAQVQQLIPLLESAKAAIVIQDFKTADSQLAKAAALAQSPSQREAASRLRLVGQHVKTFRQALADAVKEMHAAESFLVGSTRVSFVEGKSEAVILRTSGRNETYRFNDMPPGLAIAIADHKLPTDDPQSLLVKGAYLLLNKRADSQSRAKAEALWHEAQASGAEIAHLLPFLNDDYSALLKDAAD